MLPKAELEQVARECGWVKRKVVTRLGIARPTLDRWIAVRGIEWRQPERDSLYLAVSNVVKHTSKYGNVSSATGLTDHASERIFAHDMTPATEEIAATKREPVSVRMRSDLWRWARHEAIERECSAADIVEAALQSYAESARATKAKK
jgi:hypothetical protein